MARLWASVKQATGTDKTAYPKSNPLPDWIGKLLGKKKQSEPEKPRPSISDEDIANYAEGKGKDKYKVRRY